MEATSIEAGIRAAEFRDIHHAQIIAVLRQGPKGKDGIASAAGLDGHAVGRRMSELQRAGKVRPTGSLVKSASNRNEREWEAV